MNFLRILIVLSALVLLSEFQLEVVHKEGLLLCRLENMPHRGLGQLFYAHMKAPYRADFLKDYLTQYFKAVDEEWIVEGQKRPVVAMYTVEMAPYFPKNHEIQMLRRIVKHNLEVRAQRLLGRR